MVGGVMMAMSRGRRNVRFLFKTLVCSFFPHEIEQNRERVRARRSGNVTVLTDKNMGLFGDLRSYAGHLGGTRILVWWYKKRGAHHIVSFVVAVLLFLWSFLVSENRRPSALFLPRSSSSLSEVLLDSNAISRRCCSTLLSGIAFTWSRYRCLCSVSISGGVWRGSERIYRVLAYDDA